MGLRWGAWGLILALACLRALVGVETLPHWDSDPSRAVLPLTGLTPAGSLAVDVAMMLAAGLCLLGESLAGLGVSLGWTSLVLAGAAGVALHGRFLDSGSLDDARTGSTWIAAMTAGLAGMHVCRDLRIRRATLASFAGLLMLLVAKGVLQILVEHPATVAQYKADPDGFLASQGWAKGSISARNFERRLLQSEASGWFGLANVYASFAAAGLAMLTGWTLLAWRRTRDRSAPLPDGWAGVLSLAAIAAAVAVWLAGSKGGVTAAGIGLALLAGRMLLVRRVSLPPGLSRRAGGLLAVALVLSALGAVVLRGLIGERMGELSLLFRWFYMEGAVRVFREHPLLGVGPGGFKDAYMLAKPPISPEEVQSPHSVMFDFAATLGCFGLAWVAAWLGWVYGLGRTIVEPAEDDAPPVRRLDGWFVGAVAVAAVLAAIWIERAIATPEGAYTRTIGLLAWLGVAAATLQLGARAASWPWIAALGGLVIAVHGQIEVTPVWNGSTCLVMTVIAAAGARRGARGRGAAPAAMVILSAIAWAALVGPRTLGWEHALDRAAAELAPYADLAQRLSALQDPKNKPEESVADIARDVGRAAGVPAPGDATALTHDMDQLLAATSGAAAGWLAKAMEIAPHHLPTVEAYCRMRMAEGAAMARLGASGAQAAFDQALAAAEAQTHWTSAGAFGLLANVWSGTAEVLRRPELMDKAVDAWTKAAALDPYGLSFPYRAFEVELAQGHAEAARRWAGELLRLDTLQRLDELKQLTPDQRGKVQQALRMP
jgi:hypothetical protein